MESGKQRHGGIGSSIVPISVRRSSSSVEQIEREMLKMRLRDNREESDDDRDIKLVSIDGIDADSGHIILTTIDDRNGNRKRFSGDSGVDQLVEIIKVLGTPTREDIKCMNPNYSELKFPQIKAHPWHKVFQKRLPSEAIDLVCRFLQYSPNMRCRAWGACIHPFFDELRDPNTRLPTGRPLPPLFNFNPQEINAIPPDIMNRLVPEHARKHNLCTLKK